MIINLPLQIYVKTRVLQGYGFMLVIKFVGFDILVTVYTKIKCEFS